MYLQEAQGGKTGARSATPPEHRFRSGEPKLTTRRRHWRPPRGESRPILRRLHATHQRPPMENETLARDRSRTAPIRPPREAHPHDSHTPHWRKRGHLGETTGVTRATYSEEPRTRSENLTGQRPPSKEETSATRWAPSSSTAHSTENLLDLRWELWIWTRRGRLVKLPSATKKTDYKETQGEPETLELSLGRPQRRTRRPSEQTRWWKRCRIS